MTKTEIIRKALVDARDAGQRRPSDRDLAVLAGVSPATASSLRMRLEARGLAAVRRGRKLAPAKPEKRKLGRLPVGISIEQHVADLALLNRVKSEWGLA